MKNKKNKFVFACLLFSIFFVKISYSQNGPPVYTDYLNFKSIINPSFIGRERVFTIFVGANTLSSEKTGVLGITAPIGETRWSAGVISSYDKIGISKNISISPAISYTLTLGEDGQKQLRFGLTGTYNNLTNDYEKLIRKPDIFLSGQESFQYFSFGLGASLYLKNTIFSVSIPDIYSRSIGSNKLFDIQKGEIIQSFSNVFIMQKIRLNSDFHLYPSLMAYVSDFDDIGNFMLYGNVALSYKVLTLGVTTLLKNTSSRSIITSSLGGSLSVDINYNLSLGYSYRNVSLDKIRNFSNIHSLYLKYLLVRNRQLKRHTNIF